MFLTKQPEQLHRTWLCVTVVPSFLWSLVSWFPPGRLLTKIKERVRHLQLQRAKQHLLTRAASGRQPLQHVKEGRIHQKLDHFNRQDARTFPQVERDQIMFYISKPGIDPSSVSALSKAWHLRHRNKMHTHSFCNLVTTCTAMLYQKHPTRCHDVISENCSHIGKIL